MADAVETAPQRKTKGFALLVALTSGHAAIHWYQQLWPVIIPAIRSSLGLTDIQLGTLSSVKQFTTGPLFLPAGILADFFRKRTAIILAASFGFLSVSYFLVGQASSYLWIIPPVALLGIETALWHPAAVGSLSLRFPERRGSALAIHGAGASLGDTVGPIVIGFLLLTLAWQRLLELHLIPALLIALLLWRALGSVYENQEGRPSLKAYLNDAKVLAQSRMVLVIIGVNALVSMGRLSIITFLPIYTAGPGVLRLRSWLLLGPAPRDGCSIPAGHGISL